MLTMTRRTYIPFCNILRVRDPPPRAEPAEPKKSKTLWKIPLEIVEIIFQLLSDLDRACFALSCKRLHACYVSYNRQHGICVLSTLPRTLLLRRLQNERWVYCYRCQNLHRRSRWLFLRFGWICDPKPAISECNAWCDFQHDDKVDICPCSSITFHQKQHPTEYFKSQQETLRRSSYHKLSETFIHLCTIQHPLAQVFVLTRAWSNKTSKTFQVENLIVFRASKETALSGLFQKISSRLSRYETESWLKNFFNEAQSDFFIGDESSNWYQCHGWNIARGKPYDFKITLFRDLGGDRRPSKGWDGNCHK
ncbi:unnamed protein product [Penicillium salamii]|uniref:F-box domain-containing protein n=1 Tax=Penicillium salamii TaxID=1612424 RepID=A0A9W4JGE4_9EURO|nr:unnamed protein product [Penicillium salamii]CAG7979434.1 unnamed protein product [Penicillium salamii]CAG8015049.1 unnamed protein product [Penicillium salamii]CAG8024218.1 unnamed protein product [Penicillium salamii]CAG8072406.1 unnamed protein product [Penicillium salamii]